jgi:hypothetical protein
MDAEHIHIDALKVPAGASAATLARILRAHGVPEAQLAATAQAVRRALARAVPPSR